MRDWKEKSLKGLEQIDAHEKEQTRRCYDEITSWLKYDESEQRGIIDSISNEAKRYPETCSWFTQHPASKAWLKPNADTPMLCLQGIPGSGKSCICARTIDFLMARKVHVVHYFCSYSYTSTLSYEQILRSLLMQLISRSSDIIKHVHDEYTTALRSLRTTALEKLLRDVFKLSAHESGNSEYVWMVIDGLGECQAETQARITKLLCHITSRSTLPGSTVYKALLSFQSTPPSLRRLKKEHTIFLSEESVNLDKSIQQYAQFRLGSYSERLSQLDLSGQEIEELAQNIAVKSSGKVH